MTSTNRYKVSKRQWSRWSKSARQVFNSLYYQLRIGKSVLTPPSFERIKAGPWSVVAWNVAWIAADAVDESAR